MSRPKSWPVLLLALPAFVAIWSGWVGLGGLTGFGVVHPLPGIVDSFSINTAITLPIGVETYAAYAIHVWLSAGVPTRARNFARWSAIGSLIFGAAGQVAYHLMAAYGMTAAPWQITTAVSCLPVAVLGMGAALARLRNLPDDAPSEPETTPPVIVAEPVVVEPEPVVIVTAPQPEIDAETDGPDLPVTAGRKVREDVRTTEHVKDTILLWAEARPTWKPAQIAERVGRSEATVRRVLGRAGVASVSGPPAADDPSPDPSDDAAKVLAEVTA